MSGKQPGQLFLSKVLLMGICCGIMPLLGGKMPYLWVFKSGLCSRSFVLIGRQG